MLQPGEPRGRGGHNQLWVKPPVADGWEKADGSQQQKRKRNRKEIEIEIELERERERKRENERERERERERKRERERERERGALTAPPQGSRPAALLAVYSISSMIS